MLSKRAASLGVDIASGLQAVANRMQTFTDDYGDGRIAENDVNGNGHDTSPIHFKTYFPMDIPGTAHDSVGSIQRALIALNAPILRAEVTAVS